MEDSEELANDLFLNFKKVLVKLAQEDNTSLTIKYALNNEIELKRFLENRNR